MTLDPEEKNYIGDYELFDLIGKGTFASVWEGAHRIIRCPVAIKQFILDQIDQFSAQDVLSTMEREVMIMKMLDYPFIVGFYDIIRTDKSIFIVMELADEGTLLEHINKSGPLNEDTIREIFAQIIAVIQYLHNEKRIIHRDLKAENVLLDQYHNIRIIDFGLSNILNQGTSYLNTACGSPGMYHLLFEN
ncbi:CAMK family protein kinase [Tritrichomonas foetus]|uniref:CAMK family protein kinase n=1 Tax=Tritrichomonas foetus TaxID=1144522 RepID=A0A1J4JK77_9EUKA|nr:CAMK family protein kinase [Tritrichomonas foetus]|eukprot:OHS98791.1 CAMK family protein kinase [Tritrichomonas foetus]